MQACELKGSAAQIKWALSIRNHARGLGWVSEQLEVLAQVNDSTWWIANRHDLKRQTFKLPLAHQLVGGPPPPAKSVAGQNAHARQKDLVEESEEVEKPEKTEMHDAAEFAASIAHKPKLAEITVLSLLARLYPKGSPQSKALVERACGFMREGNFEHDERDLDAIARILRPLM